jgi:methionyl-tRNA formyltransferase
MRVVFAGTPEFARVALDALVRAGFTVPLVLTQPDRPAGRGMKLQASAVKQSALAHGIPVAQPRSLKLDGKFPEDAAAARQALIDARADAMVVAAYGLILPQWVLDLMSAAGPPQGANAPVGGSDPAQRRSVGAEVSNAAGPPQGANAPAGGSDPAQRRSVGALNIHGSLLPRWRGAAPIHRAIEAGDTETGVTIMQMDAGLDTGDMLLVERLPIADTDTTATLHDQLAALGARLMVEALELAACGGLTPLRQPDAGVTYAHKIEKAEAQIDWQQNAATLARRVRAFDPFPGVQALWVGEPLKIWGAQALPDGPAGALPGTVLAVDDTGVRVQTGSGSLLLTELQRAGSKRLSAREFLRGHPIAVGERLGPQPDGVAV